MRFHSLDEYRRCKLSLSDKISAVMEEIKNDPYNCVAEVDTTVFEQVKALENRTCEDLPLYGVPVLIKDNIDVKGLHTTAGSLALDDNIAVKDAPVVRNLRKSGAITVGKTNMTEFANFTTAGMPAGYSSRGGQVIHAIDPALSPSGSSSGSGVAVSAGLVPVAVGTDTSFSVIACAQENGVCGLKPPAGTLSYDGIIPISHTLDSAGAMAGNFSDALTLYSAMCGDNFTIPEAMEPAGMRIGINTANRDIVSDGQMDFLHEVIKKLQANGCTFCMLCQPHVPLLPTIMTYEFKPHLEEYLKHSAASRKTLDEIVAYYEKNPETMLKYGDNLLKKALFETEGGLESSVYKNTMQERARLISAVRSEISEYDAVMLTGPTYVMHLCGLPSVCIAAADKNDHGVNRGIIMYGADEIRLYRAALAVEKLCRTPLR